jgi:opacity protein-like surface antigen
MKGKLLILICFFSISSFAEAPTPPKGHGRGKSSSKIVLGVAVGASIPMGWYGRKDTIGKKDTLHHAGFAKTGIHFNVNFGYKFSDKVGIMILAGGTLNGFDGKAYDVAYGHSTATVTTGTSNFIGSYMVGPFFNLPAGDKLSIDIRLLGGLMTASPSTVTSVTSLPFNGSSTEISAFKASSGYGYDIGLGASYNVSSAVSIPLSIDYLGGSPAITTATYTNALGTFTSGDHKISMGVGMINISIGLALHF